MYGLKVLRTSAVGFPKTVRCNRFFSRDARDFGAQNNSFTQDHGQQFPRLSVPLEPIVQVFNTSFAYNVFQPWQNNPHQTVTGTGFAISEKRIITNAHVIGYPGTLQVCKTNSSRKYGAKLVNLSNTIDLAILRVDDPEFWDGVQPFELSEDLAPQDTLQIAGYPSGGNNISIASGSVARFAMVPNLEAEVNIAVNPGNSGGPAFKGSKVAGVVYKQDIQRKVSFVIPSVCVNSYLDHVKRFGDHRQVDGGLLLQKLENKAMREMYGMKSNETGVLVVYVIKNSSSEGVLLKNDVLLEADGHIIADDGTISHPIYGRIHYSYLFSLKYPGDKIHYKIIRDKQTKEVDVILQEYKFSTPSLYRDKPSYFIYGGIVFTKLSAYYGSQFKQGLPAPLQSKIFENAQTAEFDGQEFVVISEVLPHDVNLGYTGVRDLAVEKVNGVAVKNMKHFVQLVENNTEEYLKLDVSQDYVIAFKKSEVEEANKEIMAAFNLPANKSVNL